MTNRLSQENSPYLLQHAENPVDWFPWGDEALERSRSTNKPIFLSIGYAACHWCHVMEHESFEDPKTASLLNQHFVSIKVDREERPDLDHIYMQAVMALRGGHGGWPLSAFLTPEQDVFFGGTYWPPVPRHGLPSFGEVLERVAEAYRDRRDEIVAHARTVSQHLRSSLSNAGLVEDPDDALLVGFARLLERNFDFQFGGFGGAPKFPHPIDLKLLMRLWSRWNPDEMPTTNRLREMVERSLSGMAHGGIFDHLGGGFARYSVDAQWLVPHFEKMLYDNALLASSYVDAWKLWRQELSAVIARKTVDYLQREMRDRDGGFHSSEDADSEGEEGKFYVWSRDEILKLLGPDGPLFCDLYGVTETGNFEGHNILHLPESMEEFAAKRNLDASQVRSMARSARQTLFEVRNARIHPGRDDKVLANWNALAIDAIAQCAVAFDSPEYLATAERCAEFIWTSMRDRDGRLLHAYRRGVAKQTAFLDDYSFLILSFVSLYQASWDHRWLDRANTLAQQMERDFADVNDGGFFYTASHASTPIARWKDVFDSSIPSASATAALALQRLGLVLGSEHWLELGQQTVRLSMGNLKQSPTAAAQMLVAAETMLDRRWLVVVVAPTDIANHRNAVRSLQSHWAPHIEFVLHFADRAIPNSLETTLAGKTLIDGQATAYICELGSCRPPVVGWTAIESEVLRIIEERQRLS